MGCLETIFEKIDEREFFDYLDDYLCQMDVNRESVLQLLSYTEDYDIFDLYKKIFIDCSDYLNEDEKVRLVEKMKNTFEGALWSSLID